MSTDPSTDLVSWLRSQLDDEEQSAIEGQRRRTTSRRMIHGQMVDVQMQTDPFWRRSAWPPEMVLRTVAAHRAILALHLTEEDAEAEDGSHYVLRWCALCNEPGACVTVRHLASIYEDRPGFDPSWRVET